MSNGQQPPPPSDVFVTFVGLVQFPWTQCLRNVLTGFASQPAVKNVTILMSSPGGSVMEGFALYNLIRAMPYTCNTHNIGSIQSIANIVFLAGERRTTAKYSSFLLHNFTWTFAQETLTVPQVNEKMMSLDIARKEFTAVFEDHTNLKAKDFDAEKFFEHPKTLDAAEAVKAGIAHAIQDIKIPSGAGVLNVVQGP